MSDVKDPKIKLFGKTIEPPETSVGPAAAGEAIGGGSSEDGSNKDPSYSSISMIEDCNFAEEAGEQGSDKSLLNPKQTDAKEDGQPHAFMPGELKEPQINEGSKSLSNDRNSEAGKTSEQTDTSNSQDKTLKKPDKILPCPRCNSMDTKFCYFNNYNVSQPRHFCKNCQRYWTAGGTTRNVPVGAGRRKNKSQFRPLSLPEALHNGIDLNPNGTLLTFSSDASLPKSMASALNIADRAIRNGPHRPEELQQISISYGSKENGDSESSVAATASSKDEIPNCHPFPQFFPGAPLPYPWNPIPCIGPTFAPTRFPGAPWPYWASWAVPWVIPPMPTSLQSSGPNSPTLGKHSRDNNVAKPEKCLWVPKTLRIDDPEEAAKSSIWETLGIKNERLDSVGGRGIFKEFANQSKGEKEHVPETSAILQANPAALSRSNNFHESS